MRRIALMALLLGCGGSDGSGGFNPDAGTEPDAGYPRASLREKAPQGLPPASLAKSGTPYGIRPTDKLRTVSPNYGRRHQ
jgi:hypothetical protein